MPYVAAHEVVAPNGATLEDVAARMGPPPWRVALVASPALRAVLWSWPPAYVTVPHTHPRAGGGGGWFWVCAAPPAGAAGLARGGRAAALDRASSPEPVSGPVARLDSA